MNARLPYVRKRDEAVIDACVLANVVVADLLLKLARWTRRFAPLWSALILAEVERTLTRKFGWAVEEVRSRLTAMNRVFPDALISGFESLIEQCTNHVNDRHVLVCAIFAKAPVIVTFNLRDFKPEHLSPWGIRAEHPQDYLIALYKIAPKELREQLQSTATKRNMTEREFLLFLARDLPDFSAAFLGEQS